MLDTWDTEITECSICEEATRLARAIETEARERGRADEWTDIAWEIIDNHRWVIYCGAAARVVSQAPTWASDEAWDEFVREMHPATPETREQLNTAHAFGILHAMATAEVNPEACEPSDDATEEE